MKTKIIYTFFISLFSLASCKKKEYNIPKGMENTVNYINKQEQKSENNKIENIIVYDYYNNEIDLLKKINAKKNIFYYNDYLHCNTCVEKTFDLIKQNQSIKNKDLIILIKFASQFEFSTFKRINNLKGYEVYSLKNEELNLPVEKLDLPFFFVLNKDGMTNNYHAVIKEIPKLTIDYLDKLN